MNGRLTFTHPSRKRLRAWLDDAGASTGDAASIDPKADEVARHVEQCARCASRLEAMAESSGDMDLAPDDELAQAIREVYLPPADLTERVIRTVDERARTDQEVNLLLGLFAIPRDAAELMLPPEPEPSQPPDPAIDPGADDTADDEHDGGEGREGEDAT